MDIRAQILQEHSKRNANFIANYIGKDEMKFVELMDLFFGDEYRVTQRAAQVVSHCTDRHPQLITPYLEKMITNLTREKHVAVKRNTFRILQDHEIPDSLLGTTADICFKAMESGTEPVAVKVFAMTVLANICEKEPALKNEFQILIEDQMPYGSAGFKSRGSKILRRLSALTES